MNALRTAIPCLALAACLATVAGCSKKKAEGPQGTLGPAGQELLEQKQLDVPGAGKELDLSFKFKPDDPAHYRMAIDADIAVQAGPIGRQTIDMKMEIDFDQKAKEDAGTAMVEIPFTRQKIGMDMKMGGQNITVDIDGKEVVAKADGMEMVNTRTGVGAHLAEDFLKDLDFAGNSVSVKIDRRGRALEWEGDPNLVELFSDNAGGEGFMPLILPEGKVQVGVPWWSEFTIEKFQDIALRGDPIRGMIRFVVVGTEQRDGRTLTRIQMDAPMLIEDRKAQIYLENMGKNAEAVFKRLERTGKGTILFDNQRGLVHDARLEVGVDGTINIEVMGQELDMHLTADMKIAISLLPDGQAAPPVDEAP